LGADPASTWSFGEHRVIVEVSGDGYLARTAGQEHALRVVARGTDSLDVEIAGQIQHVRIIEIDQDLHLFHGGRQAVLRPARTEDSLQVSAGAEEGSLLTPLPGTVVAVHVAIGQGVDRGAPLVTVEAMKMEHTLTAPYAGTVTRVAFGVGERVAAGAVLAELSPTES
jgi:acetyl/propionyl-CoA carboxylase alpha subunit